MPKTTTIVPTISVVCKGLRNILLCSILITGMADWLFFGHLKGISVALFFIFFAVIIAMAHQKLQIGGLPLKAAGVLAISLLPLFLNVSLLSLFSAIAGIVAYTLILSDQVNGEIADGFLKAARLLLSGPFQIIIDMTRARAFVRRTETTIFGHAKIVAWIVPVSLGLIFFFLFRLANPLIDKWISEIDLKWFFSSIDQVRILFWFVCMALSWPFLRARMRALKPLFRKAKPTNSKTKARPALEAMLGKQTVILSLILFNLLFSIQTLLDLTYLWGGVELPSGLSYAEYAHQGIYPIILSVLLAAGFILVALRSGSPVEHMLLVRNLVYIWMMQNVLLIMSSALRLDLYVEVYSLTSLRIAAFIWMTIVFIGLITIVVRIILKRSNIWLVSTNLKAVVATLYACGFVNFPDAIASYNVKHSYELSGTGTTLDIVHTCSLGPHAIPALDRYISEGGSLKKYSKFCPSSLIRQHQKQMINWRGWSYRDWQLTKYLKNNGHIASNITVE